MSIFAPIIMKKIAVLFILAVSLMVSCKSSFEKVQKSKDYPYKLTKANEYYDKKQYGMANTLYPTAQARFCCIFA